MLTENGRRPRAKQFKCHMITYGALIGQLIVPRFATNIPRIHKIYKEKKLLEIFFSQKVPCPFPIEFFYYQIEHFPLNDLIISVFIANNLLNLMHFLCNKLIKNI